MIIGCGEWGFRNIPMEEHFNICRSFGFKHMEFGVGGNFVGRLPVEMSENMIKGFKEMAFDYSISTSYAVLENDFTLPDPDRHKDMLAGTIEQIKLLHKLGARYVRLFAGFTPENQMNDVLWEQVKRSFEVCNELCRSLGMSISIETHGKVSIIRNVAYHENTVTTDRESIKKLLQILPVEVGFNYDPGNIKAVDPQDNRYALDLLNDRINYCHLKDWKPFKDGWFAGAIGDDDLDYKPIFEQMIYEGVYFIEYEPTDDLIDGISRSLKYLDKIGVKWSF